MNYIHWSSAHREMLEVARYVAFPERIVGNTDISAPCRAKGMGPLPATAIFGLAGEEFGAPYVIAASVAVSEGAASSRRRLQK
jgi:hypothetical protein